MGKIKPYSIPPFDEGDSHGTRQWKNWATAAINQLIGQGNITPGTGSVALNPPNVDPTSSQVLTGGVRTGSVTTAIAYSATTTSFTFYWDGTNGSVPFQIYRDDGSVTPPTIVGSPLTVTGLVANTKYFFYFYYDEVLQLVKVALLPGIAIGTPPMAFTAQNLKACQQQILRNHIPLAPTFSGTGITTPASGTSSGTGGSGGGSGGGRFNLT